MSYLFDFEELNEGYVAFGGNPKGGKITGKCEIKTGKANNTEPLLCRLKGIKREFSVPRTPQQNGVAERKNRTLIETARTMLAYLLLPIPFWAEAVNTACYVSNRVLVTKPHNKTPYELLHGRTPCIGFMRPFGCLVTILNTLDHLGKFQKKVDEGFLVGYSVCRKAFRNNDKDALVNGKEHDVDTKKYESVVIHSSSSSAQTRKKVNKTKGENKENNHDESFTGYRDLNAEFEDCSNNSSNEVNVVGFTVPTIGHNFINSTNTFSAAGPSNPTVSPTYEKSSFINASTLPHDPDMPDLEDITYSDDKAVVGAEADLSFGPAWLFDIDSLSKTMNYHPVIAETQTNSNAGFHDTEKAGEEGTHTYMLFPVLSDGSTNSYNNNKDAFVDGKEHDDDI
nr:retrovirus-related Pol polyprotein from transposon TNT 1-94 [Tanacetum cinerariifolium]